MKSFIGVLAIGAMCVLISACAVDGQASTHQPAGYDALQPATGGRWSYLVHGGMYALLASTVVVQRGQVPDERRGSSRQACDRGPSRWYEAGYLRWQATL